MTCLIFVILGTSNFSGKSNICPQVQRAYHIQDVDIHLRAERTERILPRLPKRRTTRAWVYVDSSNALRPDATKFLIKEARDHRSVSSEQNSEKFNRNCSTVSCRAQAHFNKEK